MSSRGEDGVHYGRRLLSTLVDERAASNHERPFASIPRSTRIEDGYRDITYRVFANAIDRCAYWIMDVIGPTSSLETLVYVGPNDLRYQILAMAAVKTGHVIFFVSPRNTAEAYKSLFDSASADILISTTTVSPIISQVLKDRSMQHIIIPELDSLLDETTVIAIQFDGQFEHFRMRPWIILHTSGSTGIPKMVVLRHGYFTVMDAFNLLEINEQRARCGSMRFFMPFPPFHVAGFLCTLSLPCWVDSTVVLPPVAPLTADIVHAVHSHARVQYTSLAPSLIMELMKNEEQFSALGKLNGVTFAGGPLPRDTAKVVSQVTPLSSTIGATEYSFLPMLPKPRDDWEYFKFNEKAVGLEFRETEPGSGLYEMFFVRERPLDLLQAVFVTFPDLQEYSTRDCFSKHPHKPGLWKYESRLDDIIVFSNGEKLNPVTMEGLITTCPKVSTCIVVGQGKFQSALLVEPIAGDASLSRIDLLDAVWPFVQRANQGCPKHGRIAREFIIMTDSDRPLVRAAKGTVIRQRSTKLYEQEIDELFRGTNTIIHEKNQVSMDLETLQSAKASLQAYIQNELDVEEVESKDDFFTLGMDSLQVITMMRAINSALVGRKIEQKQIYDNPSVEKLALSLYSSPKSMEYSDFDADDEDDQRTWLAMDKLYVELLGTIDGGDADKRKGARYLLVSSNTAPIFQPDGGHTAWLQVVGSFLINVNNWGIVNSFGVYQVYYQTSLLADHSASAISWIGTIQGALLLIIGVVSGPLFDKGYFQAMLLLGGLGLVFALMMLSLSTQYYQVMLSQGILLGICSGLLYIPSVALIPIYFKTRRGLALGLATAGGSFGGIIYPIVFRSLLSSIGFGWATRVIGFISFLILTVAALVIRPMGPRFTRQLFDTSAIREPAFVIFMIVGLLIFAGLLVPFFLVATYAETTLGISQGLSFYLLAVLNAAQFFGRVIPGALSDHHSAIIGPETLLMFGLVLLTISAFCWIAVHTLAGYTVWLIVFGFASGMIAALPAAVLPYLSPSLAVIGTRLGMLYGMAGLGFLISTPVATAISTVTHGYLGVQVWVGVCSFVAMALYIIPCRESWTRRRLYESRRKVDTNVSSHVV